MCRVLCISRQTYYKYKDCRDKDKDDYLILRKSFEEGKKLYGYRRLKIHLRKR